jgi:hypothetical protein
VLNVPFSTRRFLPRIEDAADSDNFYYNSKCAFFEFSSLPDDEVEYMRLHMLAEAKDSRLKVMAVQSTDTHDEISDVLLFDMAPLGYYPRQICQLTKTRHGTTEIGSSESVDRYACPSFGTQGLENKQSANAGMKTIAIDMYVKRKFVKEIITQGMWLTVFKQLTNIGGFLSLLGALFPLCFVYKYQKYFEVTLRGQAAKEGETDFVEMEDEEGEDDVEEAGFVEMRRVG